MLPSDSPVVKTKGQIIAEIVALNPRARAEFLEQFEEEDLRLYLKRLEEVRDNCVRVSGWQPRRERRAAS